MKITGQTLKLMDGEKVVKTQYILTFHNEGHEPYSINVGEKTYNALMKMAEPKQTKTSK